MTTPQVAAAYLADHMAEWDGKGWAVYNPRNVSVDQLPTIYGFNNGGSPGWLSGVLLADDGECLGSHVCSSEGYMPHDLGIVAGSRPDRHETFREHYPDGYRMEFISNDAAQGHGGLKAAYQRNQQRAAATKERDS
jgi:hypothetical protein